MILINETGVYEMGIHWSFILISIQREIIQIERIMAFLLY